MSCRRTYLAVALAAATLGFGSAATAQETHPPGDRRMHDDRSDIPPADVQEGKDLTTEDPHRATTPPSQSPPPLPPPSSLYPPPYPPVTSTTQTTGAEYSEREGAELRKEVRPHRALIINGAILFLAPYVTGVVVGAQSDLDADKRLYIPLVGPWLDLGQRPCSFGSECTTSDKVGSAFLISSGVAQAIGLVLIGSSFAVTETRHEKVAASPKVHVLPVSFAGGGGLGALGQF